MSKSDNSDEFETEQITTHTGQCSDQRVYHTRECRAVRQTKDSKLRDVRPTETDLYRECQFCRGEATRPEGGAVEDGEYSLEKKLRLSDPDDVTG